MSMAIVTVATVAGWISYWHAVSLALRLGSESPLSAHLLPLTIDGMLLASALTGLFCSRYNLPQPKLARFALVVGILCTIAVNVAQGLAHGIWAAVIAGWPAVALVISSELLLWVVAAGRTLSKQAVVVLDVPDTEEAKANTGVLAEVMTILANDAKVSAAEVGRQLSLPYVKALALTKEARQLLAEAS